MTKVTKKTKVQKVQEVKVKKENVKQPTELFTDKEKATLDGFFEKLKNSVVETAKELNLATEKPQDYYVAYAYKDGNGDTRFASQAMTTNLNLYAKHGYGLTMLADRFKAEHPHAKGDVVILNIVKLEN